MPFTDHFEAWRRGLESLQQPKKGQTMDLREASIRLGLTALTNDEVASLAFVIHEGKKAAAHGYAHTRRGIELGWWTVSGPTPEFTNPETEEILKRLVPIELEARLESMYRFVVDGDPAMLDTEKE